MKIGSDKYRINARMVHLNLLRSVKEAAIILDETEARIIKEHKNKTLPFPSVEVGDCIVLYIPTFMLRSIAKVQDLGVTKTIRFLNDFKKNRLMHLLENETPWDDYDLTEWI